MPDSPQSSLDNNLERLSKVAGILLPLVVALVGGVYTYQKDLQDARTLQRQQRRDQQELRYENLTALIPLLTSPDSTSRALAMEIFTSEAKQGEAPLDLVPVITRLGNEHPDIQIQANAAVAAAKVQSAAKKSASQ